MIVDDGVYREGQSTGLFERQLCVEISEIFVADVE
jgi:hypothetical protein